MGSPLIGLWSTKYLPLTGGIHLPPMKFSYLARTFPVLRIVSRADSTEDSLTSSATGIGSFSFGQRLYDPGYDRQATELVSPPGACLDRGFDTDLGSILLFLSG